MARSRQHRYSPEFKAEALRLMADTDEPIKKIARELGVSAKTLHDWAAAVRPEPREPLTEDERSELQRLHRELVRVRMERDILKTNLGPLRARLVGQKLQCVRSLARGCGRPLSGEIASPLKNMVRGWPAHVSVVTPQGDPV